MHANRIWRVRRHTPLYLWELLLSKDFGISNNANKCQPSAEMAEPEINAPQKFFREGEATWQIRPAQDPPWPTSRKQEPVQQPGPLNRDR